MVCCDVYGVCGRVFIELEDGICDIGGIWNGKGGIKLVKGIGGKGVNKGVGRLDGFDRIGGNVVVEGCVGKRGGVGRVNGRGGKFVVERGGKGGNDVGKGGKEN